MTTIKRDAAYQMAIAAAKAELAELSAELVKMEPLIRRKTVIEIFLRDVAALAVSAQDVAEAIHESIGSADSQTVVIMPGKGKSLAEGAREVLADAKHPMTAPWIVKAMRARGWHLEAKWSVEIVRGALQRKSEMFEAVGKGFYALKEWSREMKKVSQDLVTKARHGIDPAATIQSVPDKEDFQGTKG